MAGITYANNTVRTTERGQVHELHALQQRQFHETCRSSTDA